MKLNRNWTLYYSEENDALNFKNFVSFKNVILPTLFEEQLFKNNILGNPYYSTNNWAYQRFESYHQYYYRVFNSKKRKAILRLNGVDTIADVFVNGVLVGKTNNCYLPFSFEITNLKSKNNEILIHIYPSVLEGLNHDFTKIRQVAKYNYEALYIRKPASSFGWDILPRTPLGGIYKDVELVESEHVINDVHLTSKKVSENEAVLGITINSICGVSFVVSGYCEDSKFNASFKSETEIKIINPKLWNIRGYGNQNLYIIQINAVKNGKIIDTKIIKYGIRKVELDRTSTVSANGKFEFKINDKKIFLLGSNWVPVEAIKHVDNSRMRRALKMLLDLGCNAIRVWGGGTYETEEFYSLCDKYGFFVWQDFMMGCATYPQDDEFVSLLKEEVSYKVKELRNHCSICLWAGDNENDLASGYWAINKTNPNENILTRKVIPEILLSLDNDRPYLPSSPYVDEYAYSHKDEPLSEDHLWGPRDYFKGDYYRNAYPYFTSETGYHGLNSIKSLNKFMKNPWPLFDEKDNPTKEYMCHGVTVKDDMNSPYLYRTKLMADQVKVLFNKNIDNLDDFVLASQISQAEAMKFFIEKMRRDTVRNGGIIWWNILDGWPQVSDAVVDYYFDKKLAYNYIKKSQQDILIFVDEDDKNEKLYVSSLMDDDVKVNYLIFDAYTNKVLKEGTVNVSSRESKQFDLFGNDGNHHFCIIKYTLSNGKKYLNTFHTNIINIDFDIYKKVLKRYNRFK